jgi:hypothetical protein
MTPIRCIALGWATVLLVACAAPQPTAPVAEPFCRVGELAFHSEFETAALHACGEGETGPLLTIAPEYAPINPSPWYAWRVSAEPAAAAFPVRVTVQQRYLFARHRYHPWVSVDGEDWRRLEPERVRVGEDGRLEMDLELPAGGLFVAAQPPLGNAEMEAWAAGLAAGNGLRGERIAKSPGGRDVVAYQSLAEGRIGSVVLTGRQHPPEVTGGLAFQDFSARLFADDPLAARFRSRFAIGLVPGINPDGVHRGHWRTNLRGVDLNRDWGPFTQPETQGVADWMARMNNQAPLRLFIDFHSTWQDVLYMPHPSDDPIPTGFAAAWLQRLADRLGGDGPDWSGQHNPGLPTAKSWVRKAYGIVALTYEVGDVTPREKIRRTAEAAAEEMMKLMLEIEAPNP